MTNKSERLQQAAEELLKSIEQERAARQAKAQALLERLSAPPPRYTPAELKFINFLQRECAGRPMSREEIKFQLDLAKAILGPDLTG